MTTIDQASYDYLVRQSTRKIELREHDLRTELDRAVFDVEDMMARMPKGSAMDVEDMKVVSAGLERIEDLARRLTSRVESIKKVQAERLHHVEVLEVLRYAVGEEPTA